MKNTFKIILQLGKKYGKYSQEQMRAYSCETNKDLIQYGEIMLGENVVKNILK